MCHQAKLDFLLLFVCVIYCSIFACFFFFFCVFPGKREDVTCNSIVK